VYITLQFTLDKKKKIQQKETTYTAMKIECLAL